MGLLDLIGHKYPFTDFHELNLDWCITAILQLQKAFEDFSAGNKLTFANPLQHDLTRTYAKNTIVVDPVSGTAYLSLDAVPVGVQLTNADYWLPVFDFAGYVTRANQNFTDNYFSGTDRTPIPLAVGDWVVLDDVLYKVTAAMAADDLFIIGTNIEHFTVEQFLKDFVTSINQTVLQYKNDIDASEYAYRQQLAQDIAQTTASLQAQLDLAISGATVDSEVINARLGADGVVYNTLGDAIRDQIGAAWNVIGMRTQITASNYSTDLPSLNDALVNRIYGIFQCLQSITDIPNTSETSGTLITYAYNYYSNGTFYTQILSTKTGVFIRSCWGGRWTTWIKVANEDDLELFLQPYAQEIRSSNYSSLLPSFNDAEVNRIYGISNCLQSISDIPNTNRSSGTLMCFAYSDYYANKTFRSQLFLNQDGLFSRSCWSGTWSSWIKTTDEASLSLFMRPYTTEIGAGNYSSLLPSLNDAEINKIYGIFNCLQSISDIPNTARISATLMCFAYSDYYVNKTFRTQLLFNQDGMFSRSCWGGTWTSWIKVANEDDLELFLQPYAQEIRSSNYSSLLPSFNDAEVNRIYGISNCLQSISDIPNTNRSSGTLMCFAYSDYYANKTFRSQLFLNQDGLFSRSCWSGTWTPWMHSITDDNITGYNTGINLINDYFVATCVNKIQTRNIGSGDKVIFFGDSITEAGWPTNFASMTGCTAINNAVGGALFGHSDPDRPSSYWISTQIDNTAAEDWSGCDLVIVAAGTNDAGHDIPLSEVATYVQDAIDRITGYTNAPIVFLTPIRRDHSQENSTNLKLPEIAGIIVNKAIINDCSVINGFDVPMPTYSIDSVITDFTNDHDGLHPDTNGKKAIAQAVVNALF